MTTQAAAEFSLTKKKQAAELFVPTQATGNEQVVAAPAELSLTTEATSNEQAAAELSVTTQATKQEAMDLKLSTRPASTLTKAEATAWLAALGERANTAWTSAEFKDRIQEIIRELPKEKVVP